VSFPAFNSFIRVKSTEPFFSTVLTLWLSAFPTSVHDKK
jgi:hypothetical protein